MIRKESNKWFTIDQIDEDTAEAIVSGIYDVRLENDVLKLSEDQILYRDQPIQEGRFKPVAFQSEHRFYVKAQKLHYEYNGKCFDVDSKTMIEYAAQNRYETELYSNFNQFYGYVFYIGRAI